MALVNDSIVNTALSFGAFVSAAVRASDLWFADRCLLRRTDRSSDCSAAASRTGMCGTQTRRITGMDSELLCSTQLSGKD